MDNDAIDWSSFLELDDLPDWLTSSEETSADGIFENDQCGGSTLMGSRTNETTIHDGLLLPDKLERQQSANPISSIGWSQPTENTRVAWHYNHDSGAPYGVFEQPVTALSLQLASQALEIDVGTRLNLGSALSASKKCECIVCLGLGGRSRSMLRPYVCRVRGCHQSFTTQSFTNGTKGLEQARYFHAHEMAHFHALGGYKCAEKNCNAVIQAFSDLKRHYTSKHCTNRKKYPCSVIGCKYGGEHGFARKDKLTSHFKNMHAGNFPATTPIVRSGGQVFETGNPAAEGHI